MAEFTDPLIAYLVGLLLLIAGAAGAGYLLTDHLTGAVPTAVVIGIIGFVSGLYVAANQGEWFGFMFVSGGAALVLAYFLPLEFVQAIAVFLIGYIVGLRTERR